MSGGHVALRPPPAKARVGAAVAAPTAGVAAPAGDAAAPARDESPALGPLAGLIGFHLARARVSAVAAYDEAIGRPFKLRRVEFSLLQIVRASGAVGAVGAKRLAQALRLSAPALTMVLDRLQQRGLVRRERNPADRRSQIVTLTDAGAAMAEDTARAAGPMERGLAGRLSPAEHAMLIELLGKLAAAQP